MFGRRKATTPGGTYFNVYRDMAEQTHLLIAGKTGAGKSVVINGIIHSLLVDKFPAECQLILIDPKRVELSQWRNTPHCTFYASEPGEPCKALKIALQITETRYKEMQKKGQRKYGGGHVYVIIDELADLITTCKTELLPLLQRLAQIGRAANVHIIAATQCPLAKVIPTEVKVNFDAVLGLRTVTAQHSRNIIGRTGCETLPAYGFGYYDTPNGSTLQTLPMVADNETRRVITHWTH